MKNQPKWMLSWTFGSNTMWTEYPTRKSMREGMKRLMSRDWNVQRSQMTPYKCYAGQDFFAMVEYKK